MTLELRPKRGGFQRDFGCGEFIRDFLLGKAPFDSLKIDPQVGSPQATIFQEYKLAMMRGTALDRATRLEEKRAKKQNRKIDPDKISGLAQIIFEKMPYKAQGCRFHSFIVYFSNLQRHGWVEFTGRQEPSEFQDHYPEGQPRKYFRLTKAGKEASDDAWRNPHRALYG